MVFHYMSAEDVETALQHPLANVASDGGVREAGVGRPHPRSWGTNARVFTWLVRERRALRLEDAVRRMTSLPARTFGFRDRGQVRPGLIADLLIFDPERVRDKATYGDPHQPSEGFDWVFVAGQPVIAEGEWTDARPGRVVRRAGSPAAGPQP
jgi:N-acyl-D-amino-acid deacylase